MEPNVKNVPMSRRALRAVSLLSCSAMVCALLSACSFGVGSSGYPQASRDAFMSASMRTSASNVVSEVVAGVRGRGAVIVDGGFRRGTDIFKGLALGATACGIGRPYIWGLGAFGQEGVEMGGWMRLGDGVVYRVGGGASQARR